MLTEACLSPGEFRFFKYQHQARVKVFWTVAKHHVLKSKYKTGLLIDVTIACSQSLEKLQCSFLFVVVFPVCNLS